MHGTVVNNFDQLPVTSGAMPAATIDAQLACHSECQVGTHSASTAYACLI
jgi:hypothetical protein